VFFEIVFSLSFFLIQAFIPTIKTSI